MAAARDDLRPIADYYGAQCGLNADKAYSDVHKIDERVFDINDGLCDFALAPQLARWPEIAHAALIEKFAVKNEAYVRFCLFPPRKCGIILAFQGEKRKNKWTLQMKCGVIPPRT